MDELWFTANETIDLLKKTFGERIISRRGIVAWPSRPCDLTPLDYFLWGYVKLLVYTDKPETIDDLEENIQRVIGDIRPAAKKWSKIGPLVWNIFEPAATDTCPKSYLKHSGITISLQ